MRQFTDELIHQRKRVCGHSATSANPRFFQHGNSVIFIDRLPSLQLRDHVLHAALQSYVTCRCCSRTRQSKQQQRTIDECGGTNVHHTSDYATYLETLYLLRFAGLGRIVGDHLDSRSVPDGHAITAVRMPTTHTTPHHTTPHHTTPHHTTPHSKTRRSKPPTAVRSTAARDGGGRRRVKLT